MLSKVIVAPAGASTRTQPSVGTVGLLSMFSMAGSSASVSSRSVTTPGMIVAVPLAVFQPAFDAETSTLPSAMALGASGDAPARSPPIVMTAPAMLVATASAPPSA